MVDAKGIEAHHMRLGTDQVAVAASDMNKRPQPNLGLYEVTQCHVAHPGNRQRIICKSQSINSRFLQRGSAVHKPADIQIARRIKLHYNGMSLLN
ncbi:hypothetical protein D3C77_266860 [compost metagenome]